MDKTTKENCGGLENIFIVPLAFAQKTWIAYFDNFFWFRMENNVFLENKASSIQL